MNSQVIFGIDVSKKSSAVCIVIDRVIQGKVFSISNDLVGFNQLYERLNQYLITPLVVFEATGVYSLPLQSFLEDKHIKYLRMNPLVAKKIMDNNLRHNKTDKGDAYKLAMIQFVAPQQLTQPQPQEYHEMQNASRYYEELTNQIIVNKNQLHRHLQSTFPQIESIMTIPTGKIYWSLVSMFPHAQCVLDLNDDKVYQAVLSISGVGTKRARYFATRLISLAKQAVAYDEADSITIRAIQRNISQLFSLNQERKDTLTYLHRLCMQVNARALTIYTSIPGIAETTALRLIAELGDLRRFNRSSQIDAFVGIDPGRYQSGETDSSLSISKHGNAIARKILYRTIVQMETVKDAQPCHITDYYDKKKRSSQTKGFKKITIASVHKLIRTMYALVMQNKLYDYNIANNRTKRL